MARSKKTETERLSAAPKKPPAPSRKEAFFYLLRKWFITGILSAAPIVITVALVWTIVSFTDNMLKHLLPAGYEPAVLFGHEVPGLGLIFTFVSLTVIGALISNFFGRYFIRVWDKLMARLPLINGVYGAIKQVLNSVLSEQGQSFREVVYVEFPQPGMHAMGFVVGAAEHFPGGTAVDPMMSIFIPMVPVPTSGFLITLPQSKLIKSDMSVEEGLKLTVTLGLVKRADAVTTLAGAE